MDKFEQQFEDLDVQAEYMEGAIGQTTALSTPASEVDSLMAQVADEHGLEMAHQLGGPVPSGAVASTENEQDDLAARLAA